MRFFTRLLFEDRALLLMCSAIAIAVALAIHRRNYSTQSKQGVWITMAMCALLLVVQHLVVTQAEALRETVGALVKAVNDGDMAAMSDVLADEVRLGTGIDGVEVDRAVIVRMTELALTQYEIRQASVRKYEPQPNGDIAHVAFSVMCDIRGSEMAYNTPSRWKCRFSYDGEQWRLDQINDGQLGLANLGPTMEVMPFLKSHLNTAISEAASPR